MADKKDLSMLTLDELLAEKKKSKSSEIFSAGLIGVLIGVMIYSVANGGFRFLPLAMPLFLIVVIYWNSRNQKQNLKRIQAEIDARDGKQDSLF